MANVSKKEIDSLVRSFADELLALFRQAVLGTLSTGKGRRSSASSAEPKAERGVRGRAKAAKGGRRSKSSPEEVEALAVKIHDALKKSNKRLSSKELQNLVKVYGGAFQYALGKLKEDGRVKQLGERRMAKYELGSGTGGGSARKKPGPKKGSTRKPKAPVEAPAAESAEAPAAEG